MATSLCALGTASSWIATAVRVVFDFSRHLVLLGALGMVLGMLFLRLGNQLGLPSLFERQGRRAQLAIGLAISMLASELFFVSYIVSPVELRNLEWPGTTMNGVTVYFIALWGALLGFVVLVAAGRLGYALKQGKKLPSRGPDAPYTLLGAGIGLAITIMILRAATHSSIVDCVKIVSDWAWPFVEKAALFSSRPWGATPSKATLGEHVYAMAFFFSFLLVYAGASCLRSSRIPAAFGLCVLLSLVGAVDGFFVYWLEKWHSLLLLGIGLLALFLLGGDRYRRKFEDLQGAYPKGNDLPGKENMPCTDAACLEHYDARNAELPKKNCAPKDPWKHIGGGKRPLVLVCTSGGGIRAAVWTAAILRELEMQLDEDGSRRFPYHVRMISGASGGMVGAAYWAATLVEPSQSDAKSAGAVGYHVDRGQNAMTGENWLVDNVAKESLSRVAAALVFGDLFVRLVDRVKKGRPRLADRGTALEMAFVENMPALGKKLVDLRPAEAAGFCPSLVWSPMLVEDGKRLLVSNLDLDGLLLQRGPEIGNGTALYSRSGYEIKRLFPAQYEKNLRLVTASRMSASFPFFSPAAVLPTLQRRRVVDAGYWDNYGVNIACGWLDEVGRDWLEQHVSGVLLVQIRDGVDQEVPETRGFLARVGRSLEGLTSPISAVFSARESVMRFRNDEQVEAIARKLEPMGEGFFQQVTFSYKGGAPLSWYLSPEELEELVTRAASDVETKAPAIRSWWRT